MSTPAIPKHGVLHNLYVGTGAFDIIGKRKRWYIAFAVIIAICLGSMAIKGFNYGIDFTGGTQIQMPVKGQNGAASVDGALQVYKQTLGRDAEQGQTVGSGPSETIQLRSVPLDATQVVKLKEALFAKFKPLGANGQPTQQAISDSAVSSSWGGEISQQALIALAVFLVLVTIFLTFYFERAMAAAALASLVNDLIVTAGVYSLVRLRGLAGHRDRLPDHPRVLAVRHRGRVRQGPGEHPRHQAARHLLRGGQPGGQPDPGPLDQHLGRRPAADRLDPGHRHGPAGRGHAGGPGAGPVRRHATGAYSSIFMATPLLADLRERSRR